MRVTLCLTLLLGCASATPDAGRDRIPRQRSVDRYIAMLENPRRASWQDVEGILAAMQIEPGMRVADVGTGSGYFLPALHEAVGQGGAVVAQDIDAELVEHVRRRIERERLHRVSVQLGRPDHPGLATSRFDRILLVDVYHHVTEPIVFLRRLAAALRPGGRLYIVDFAPGDHVPTRIAGLKHRVKPGRVQQVAEVAGLSLVRTGEANRYQFMLELRGAAAATADPGAPSSEAPSRPAAEAAAQ